VVCSSLRRSDQVLISFRTRLFPCASQITTGLYLKPTQAESHSLPAEVEPTAYTQQPGRIGFIRRFGACSLLELPPFRALKNETRSESAYVSARFGLRSSIGCTYRETGIPRIERISWRALTSRGERGGLSSHFMKSANFTSCSTRTSATNTFTTLGLGAIRQPIRYREAPPGPARRSAGSGGVSNGSTTHASYTVAAITSTVCETPSISLNRDSARSDKHIAQRILFAFCSSQAVSDFRLMPSRIAAMNRKQLPRFRVSRYSM